MHSPESGAFMEPWL